ncbi:dicarboxylate/amino acid:cation symporter, partial [Glaciecola sp. HTCC2999]|uniref:dicarboxylate/amino acid:cation symporter n=1 Tax=Glaciecola sp. HTCC2999 TaxID=455436 RepID=UPI0000E0EDC6
MTALPASDSHKLSLTARIFIGMLAGVLVGFLFKLIMGESGDLILSFLGLTISIKGLFIDGIFNGLGQIFIASLKMLVVPLVFVSLVCGTSSLSDPNKLGRLGAKSVGLYVMTTAIAIATAIFMALLFAPGEGLNLTTDTQFTAKEAPNLVQVFVDMFPANPIASMAEGNMLQIIVFAVIFGIAVSLSGEVGKRVSAAFNDINVVIMNIVTMVMNIAPYGVFVLMAKLFATIGLDTILGLAKYFFLLAGLLVMHAFVTYPIIFKVLSGLNPLILLRKMRNTALFAFSTSSS